MNNNLSDYYTRGQLRIGVILILGATFYIFTNLVLQYFEKIDFLNQQATYVARAIRNDLVTGNQFHVYEQCRSLFSDMSIEELKVSRGIKTYCSETRSNKSFFYITSNVPVRFNPSMPPSNENLVGNILLRVKADNIFYNFIFLIFFVGTLVIAFFIILKRFYTKVRIDILDPLIQLSDIMKNNSRNVIQISNLKSQTTITEINELYTSYILLTKQIVAGEDLLRKQSRMSALVDISKQVAHDIRSPLSALMLLSGAIDSVPEEKRLIIRSAIQRINDIANDLLQKSNDQIETAKLSSNDLSPKSEINLIPTVVDLIISEKRIQYRDKIDIEIISDFSNSYGEFVLINANELKRVLSNLINNSIESFFKQIGKVRVCIRSEEKNVAITVIDDGQGIPAHILSKLGEKGVTHGKDDSESGSGLGIYHAKKCIESFNGKFVIQSVIGSGTTITMSFPRVQAPDWFVEKLTLNNSTQIISLDDDLSIHQIWKGRLQSLNAENFGITLLSFTSGKEFKNYIEMQANGQNFKKIFLMDYELLNQNMTGLDLIEDLRLGKNAILVTSRYEEEHIRIRCAKLGVKLIPKGMAGFVPIEIKKFKKQYDVILIDDDNLVHITWKMVAKEKNKNIQFFNTEFEFLARANEFTLDTPIYIDVNLADDVNGIEVAKRIYDLGFFKLYLTTGYVEIEKPIFIEAIVGKDPQF